MSATKLPKVGDRIRYIGRPPGERCMGVGDPVRWLVGGAEGVVTEIIRGYPAHPCMDHGEWPDCVCSSPDGSRGMLAEMLPSPVVAYAADPVGVVERCIAAEEEGKTWERVRARRGKR